MAHDVFISHSAHDKTIADAVCATLERCGIRCWIAPRDILPGKDWDTAIITAIKSSKVMVLVFSAKSNDSLQVHREVKVAFSKGITVVPLRLDNATLNENLEFFMGFVHWLDALTPPVERHLTHLAETIQVLLGLTGSDSSEHRVFQGAPDPAIARLVAADESGTAHAPPGLAGVEIRNSIGMKLKLIPAGQFWMGSPESEVGGDNDEQRHQVRITKPFYLGMYEVTQEEYQGIIGKNPSYFANGGEGADKVSGLDTRRFPVETVSWDDARQFCEKLAALPAERTAFRRYRLPTEAEWEYACRAGTTTPFSFGSELSGHQANCDGNHPYGTTVKRPFLKRTTDVGTYAPNAFALYDMHGNVFEWCADWYDKHHYANSPSDDPPGPVAGVWRVFRGGDWYKTPAHHRCANRDANKPSGRGKNVGFRVVCELA